MRADLKTIQDLFNPNIDKCLHCGHDEFYYNQKITGTGTMNVRYDGEVTENGDMHDCLEYTPVGKFAYCKECKKRVFRFRE